MKQTPKKKVNKMQTKVELSDERIKTLLCSAFEGGSNYWIERVDVPLKNERNPKVEFWHECPIYGDKLVVHCSEDEKAYTLDRAALEKGLEIMVQNWPEHFANVLNENDDAETGDVYLQCCLFGDIVYS